GPPPARGGSRRGTRPPEPAPESRRTARPSTQFTTRPRRFVPARSEPCRGPSRGDWAATENCTTTLAGWGESDASTGHSQCGWRLPRHQRGDPGRGPDGQPAGLGCRRDPERVPGRGGERLHRAGPQRDRGAPSPGRHQDRKSTRLNSSHVKISYAVFCLKKKNTYWLCIFSYHALFALCLLILLTPQIE